MFAASLLNIASEYSIFSGCIICVFGMIGNLLNLITFSQLKVFRNNRSAFYLSVESMSNLVYELLSSSLVIVTIIYGDDGTGRSWIWCKIRYILGQSCVLISLYALCFTAIDQYLSTNYRFYQRQTCSMRLVRLTSVVLSVFAIIHSIALGMAYDVFPSVGCVLSNRIWIEYSSYFFYPFLAGIIPIVLTGIFGILAFQNVRHIVRRQIPIVRRRLDKQMTALVLLRTIVFICLVLPYSIYRIYLTNFPINRTQPMAFAIGRLIQVGFVSYVSLHYAGGFYVYFLSSSRFRRQVRFILVNRIIQYFKRSCCLKTNRVTNRETNIISTNLDSEENV